MKIFISLFLVFTPIFSLGEATSFCDAIESHIERQEKNFVKLHSTTEKINLNILRRASELIGFLEESLSIQEQHGCLESKTQD